MLVTRSEAEVVLPRVDFDTWERVRRAFGRKKTVTRECLSKYGVGTQDIRHFIRDLGLLKVVEGGLQRRNGVTVLEKGHMVVRDYVVAAPSVDEVEEQTRVQEIVDSLSLADRDVLLSVLRSTQWTGSNGQALIKLRPIVADGYSKGHVINVLNRFGFDYHEGSSGMSLPQWWKDLLPGLEEGH